MAIRLGLAFGTTPQYRMNLQSIYDLKTAQAELPPETLGISALVAAWFAIGEFQRNPVAARPEGGHPLLDFPQEVKS
jgi:hypothetical protein